MENKKKLIIATSIILGVLVLTLGITYAAFTYNKTGETSKLVLGDIWMKYTENNQLTLADAMPMDINNYTTYKVNPVMASQSVEENELSICVNYFQNVQNWTLASGETFEAYCQGTGTEYGITFQEDLDDWMLGNEVYFEYLSTTNIIIQDGDSYIVNPIMATQKINELNNCVSFLTGTGMPLAEGTTIEDFCKGTGKASNEYTFQENLDNGDWFSDEMLAYFGQYDIIDKKINNLPYFEFTISGKNTYPKKDIWYEIVLTYGDNHETRTTRIRDNLLKFTLIKVGEDSDKILLSNESYSSLNNKRIWVETINANTTTEINNTYRLYMWIDENTIIGNVDEDYTLEEWNDVFASIKVGVNGALGNEKFIYTDESCFTYEPHIIVNPVMASQDASDETTELYKCITYFTDMLTSWDQYDDDDAEAYCRGIGTIDGSTFQDDLNSNILFGNVKSSYEDLIENNVIITDDSEVVIIDYNESCGSDVIMPNTIYGKKVIGIGNDKTKPVFYGYYVNSQPFTNITSLTLSNTIEYITPYSFAESSLQDIIIPNSVESIYDFAFIDSSISNVIFQENSKLRYLSGFMNSQITSIEIPNSVRTIGFRAFQGAKLTSLEIPNNVTTIGIDAFNDNSLTNIEIPDSVTTIGDNAFYGNKLETVTIGNGIQYIDRAAFEKNSKSNPDLESITFTSKTCEEIKNIQASSTDTTKYFPWLYDRSPYYQTGYEASIIGTDGVCSY